MSMPSLGASAWLLQGSCGCRKRSRRSTVWTAGGMHRGLAGAGAETMRSSGLPADFLRVRSRSRSGIDLSLYGSGLRSAKPRMLDPSSAPSAKHRPPGFAHVLQCLKMRRCRAGPFHIFARALLRLVSPTWSRWTSRLRRSARLIGPRHWQPIAGICCGSSMGLAALKPERSKAELDQEDTGGHLRRSSRPWPARAGVSWPEWDLSRRTNGPRLEDSSNDVAFSL